MVGEKVFKADAKLFSVQLRTVRADEDVTIKTYIRPIRPPEKAVWPLGRADIAFVQHGRSQMMVQLLIRLSFRIDVTRFAAALQETLQIFQCAAGRRVGLSLCGSDGVRLSQIRLAKAELMATPPPWSMFDPLTVDSVGHEVLTVRISVEDDSPVSSEQAGTVVRSAIGVTFDHSLSDVGGMAHLLAHVSARYTGEGLPTLPECDRACQPQVATLTLTPSTATPFDPSALQLPPPATTRPTKGKGCPGGAACVQWSYSARDLEDMKAECCSRTRHEALFAEIVLLLRHADHYPLTSVSISRDQARFHHRLTSDHTGSHTG